MFGLENNPKVLYFSDLWYGRPAVPRHRLWGKVRGLFIARPENSFCAVCGHRGGLNVHHIKPFHAFPDLELDLENLITLGEACPTGNHHLLFGHLGDWRSWNAEVVPIASQMYQLKLNRPYAVEVI